MTKTCIICGKEFIVPPNCVHKITCSDECSLERRRRMIYQWHLKHRKTKKTYAKREYDNTPRNTYYCFRCEKEFKSLLPAGEAICVFCGSSKINIIAEKLSTDGLDKI